MYFNLTISLNSKKEEKTLPCQKKEWLEKKGI